MGFLLLLVVTIDFAASCSLRAGEEREREVGGGRETLHARPMRKPTVICERGITAVVFYLGTA